MSLSDYQTDHLFLLVGQNPLPNYVAARTLLVTAHRNKKTLLITGGKMERKEVY